MAKIRKGDKVVVLTGKDKGKQGSVLRVLDDNRVLVEKINMITRHVRPNPNQGVTGGRVEQEAPLQISNVALVNPATGKADRVGYKILEDGKKVRYFKSNGEVADV
ncbi:MAG: 50S ribosomal protein L24 [Gammaproteobacteria bacterium]|nr:50S ribosomal protein L24 [Gammaproteobacteria bacterium]